MKFYSRKLIKPGDLNANDTLFGGTLLKWIDEEAAIYVSCQLDNGRVVTKYMSEINFAKSARKGDVVEIGMETKSFGRTSITVSCEVRNKFTHDTIITIDKIVFVNIDEEGRPTPHHKIQMTQS
ncbi:MAG TPA: hotdog domain-containing protein [Balneolales bacterium]|nr:hotdog domain-containing protein [Balneolales bacterium]